MRYTDQSLRINLDAADIIINPIEEQIKNKLIGGKGYDFWLMWNAVSGDTKWDDPENAICISSGPLGGTPGYPGGGKSIVTSISPLTGADGPKTVFLLLQPLNALALIFLKLWMS